jgi:hypothetical protein
MNDLQQPTDLEYLFNNYIKARRSSNSKTRQRAYTLLHVALVADMVYLDGKEFVKESRERQGIDVAEEIAKILQEELKEATSKCCKYDICWTGRCNENVVEGTEYCQEHLEQKCYTKGCEEQAEGECHGYSGSMVCGAPMCKNHKHKH